MPSVLVVEDDADSHALLDVVLRAFGYDVVAARTGADGLRAAATRHPDLVVVDLGLPDIDGLEVIRELREWSAVPVLVLSGSARRTSRADALDRGADDFLAKPFHAAELGARLRALGRRGPRADAVGVRRFGDDTGLAVDPARTRATLDGAELRLTPTEWRLLEALTRNPGELVTHRWLLAQVWDATHGRETVASLRAHVKALRAKLRDDPAAPTYLGTESGVGYRWVAAPRTGTDLEGDLAAVAAALPAARRLRRGLDGDGDGDGGLPGDTRERAEQALEALAHAVGRAP